MISLNVVNLETARFDCTFGRGCEGICCRNGRPGVYDDELAMLARELDKLLPHMRPEAQKLATKEGLASKRLRMGQPMLRVVDGWCIFFNEGCILHKVGAMEGNSFKYKPVACALFPLTRTDHDDDVWYIRQEGTMNEIWDLPCLKPTAATPLAKDSCRAEIELAERLQQADLACEAASTNS